MTVRSELLKKPVVQKPLTEIEKLVLTLQEAIEHNRKVSFAIEAIIKLADQKECKKDGLNKLGTYELVLRAFYTCDDDSHTTAVAVRAIGVLGLSMPSTRKTCLYYGTALREQDRIKVSSETLMVALKRHPFSEEVIVSVCASIWKLSSSLGGAQGLVDHGACEGVVAAVLRNHDSETIAQEALFSLGIIASWRIGNNRRLADCGALPICLQVLRKFIHNERLVAIACETISYLANDQEEHQSLLINMGACELVIDALHRHRDSYSVIWFASHILLDLYYNTKSQRASLVCRRALTSSGRVLAKSYEEFITLWRPDAVLKEVRWHRRKQFVLFLSGFGLMGSKSERDVLVQEEVRDTKVTYSSSHSESALGVFLKAIRCRKIISEIAKFL